MFNNELGISFDWYQRDTKNMLVPAEGVPVTFGAGAPKGNYVHFLSAYGAGSDNVAVFNPYGFHLAVGTPYEVGLLVESVNCIARYGVTARLPSPDTIAVTAPSPRLSHRTTGLKATPTHSTPRPTIWGTMSRK